MSVKTPQEKRRDTLIKRLGGVKEYEEFMKANGSKGGKRGTGHEFAHGLRDPVKTGSLGGRPKGYKKVNGEWVQT